MMESLSKVIEVLEKHSWAAVAALGFLLSIPDDFARQINLFDFRNEWQGGAWLALVFVSVVAITSLSQRLLRFFSKKLKSRKENSDTLESQLLSETREFEAITLRLDSLSFDEEMWFKHCLWYREQSLVASITNPIARSLCDKKLLVHGSGSPLGIPYHIPDRVWKVLIKRQDEFLSESERNDQASEQILERFRADIREM